MAEKLTRTDLKKTAQNALMHGIGNVLGYDKPHDFDEWSEKDQEAYREILQREADRVAKLFGYDKAWSN
ncbi:hypothetical protein [Kitasatospora aureofaciens]|uniref:hypothetical protein n=1 Tax=Kitasatospora aureofaciens TaxID=1894 RepID=UPI003407AE41